MIQYYILNIDHSKMLEIIRGIETNSLKPKQKQYLRDILNTIVDQKIEEVTV